MTNASDHNFDCQQCGAHLTYQPGTQHIACEYCGHQNDIDSGESQTTYIEESDLDSFLAKQEGLARSSDTHAVVCPGCSAETIFPENIQSTHCPFCDTPLVSDNSAAHGHQITPSYLLPFDLKKEDAIKHFQKWVNSLWFAPSSLKQGAARLDKMVGMYLPYWTYDASTVSYYVGERGDYYYVDVQYTDNDGKEQTRQERKVRWRTVRGEVANYYDDVLVAATSSLPTEKLNALAPWDLKALKPYDSAYLSGFVTEKYSVGLKEGFASAKQVMDKKNRQSAKRKIGGDEQKISSLQTRYSDVTFKHILLPSWVSSYRYQDKAYQIVINARTGEVQGERPWSVIKVISTVAAVTATFAGAFFYLQLYQ